MTVLRLTVMLGVIRWNALFFCHVCPAGFGLAFGFDVFHR
jgi:hypothetical protein